MEVEEEHVTGWNSGSDSMVSATVGRMMNTLLIARPKKLQDSISRLDSAHKENPFGVSLEHSLWILHKYVRDAAEKEDYLDKILIPMIQHSLKSKESKYKNQELLLLNWLFQDELLFQALARNFPSILLRKEDHHISLGWCILSRGLIEHDITINQFNRNGIKERHKSLLKSLCSCIPHLLSMVCSGSTLQDGFELPTRLSVAAADCIISITIALTRKDIGSDIFDSSKKLSKPYAQNLQSISASVAIGHKKVRPISLSSELSGNMEMGALLWDRLYELIMLVQRLFTWSRKSRSLHAKGLERVLKWLQGIKKKYHFFQDQAGSQMVKTGTLLLSSCWKHYGGLLHLEDHQSSVHLKELLGQYLSGIQCYAENYMEEPTENKDSGVETINFFLNCLLLILGRFTQKKFESAMTEYGLDISRATISLLCSIDEDVIDGAVSIFKATMFGTNHSVSGCSSADKRLMDSALPLLLNLLDERDGTARAVITLVAEYCSIRSDRYCLDEVLKRLATGNAIQRRNAVDIISELVHILSDAVTEISHSTWREIAKHLLDCLGDEELVIRAHAANLISILEPSLVLPALVRLVYSSDERLQSSASNTLVDVLICHNQRPEVMCMLLDCLSNLDESEAAGYRMEGLKLDTDRVLKLIPDWSKSVKDWNILISSLLDKMFAEPSNATIVRFLSFISEHLAEAADVVFRQLLLHTEQQDEIDECFFTELEDRTYTKGDVKLQHSLFVRLCPLLIIRLLPLSVFDDLKSSLVYDDLLNQLKDHDNRSFDISNAQCIATLLLKRALNKFEFEDVRKLAAELCGRIHPHVLLPVLSSQLECAVIDHDVLKIKACLFSFCTSLVVRGRRSLCHPVMPTIRKTIETVLLWPSVDGDEISKAQHGCIDCLALMICTELQDPELFRDSMSEGPCCGRDYSSPGNDANGYAVHAYVIDYLTFDENKLNCFKLGLHNHLSAKLPLPFRLCMANVLISACQKISDSRRKHFAWKTLPRIINAVETMKESEIRAACIQTMKESEIRAACIQVLFSAVCHLKSSVLPYTSALLKVSVEALKRGSEKERMAGAKLMASLMASEEAVVESIAGGLLEARTLLLHVSTSDSSSDLRHLCNKLLGCMTSL